MTGLRIIEVLTRFKPCAVATCLGVCVSIAPLTATVSEAAQVMSGGGAMGGPGVLFTSPGLQLFDANAIAPGKGEKAAQLRMPPGTLSRRRVRVITQFVPSSGALIVTVRINGANTALTCSVSGTGHCGNAGSVSMPTPSKRLSIEIANSLVAAGSVGFTYTLEFE